MVYNDCKISKVYKDNKSGRNFVVIYFPNGTKKSTAYARFLVEKNINRILDKHETVDHIDRNFNNDNISNLQILEFKKHVSLDNKRIKNTSVICLWCKKEFVIQGNKIRNRNRRKSGPFCSRKCSGKYGAELQNKRINIASKIEIKREYYYLEKRDVSELV